MWHVQCAKSFAFNADLLGVNSETIVIPHRMERQTIKIKLSLFLTKHHDMKTYWRSGV
jgi:hypothetical protein